MKIISLFSGCGGLDLGFTNAGFKLAYANDFDKAITETFEKNHGIELDTRSINDIKSEELPTADGIIGGPPCQSWSLAGAMKGIKDKRGRLFYEYIRVIRDKKPKFFLAENVPGIISSTHLPEFKRIIGMLEALGYNVSYHLVDARDYGVPQERKRVIVIGYRKDLHIKFSMPLPTHSKTNKINVIKTPLRKWVTLKEAIGNLPAPLPAKEKNKSNANLLIPNNEYFIGSYSTIYMSRNRVRGWDEQSFTIQASGRHAPLHPSSSKMKKVAKNRMQFVGEKPTYRRLSVREAARIQTFPDDFIFYYGNLNDGYKMIGNAVPVKLAEAIALKIETDLSSLITADRILKKQQLHNNRKVQNL